jgi:hypothetical protein
MTWPDAEDAHAYLLDNPPIYMLYADYLEAKYEMKIRNRYTQSLTQATTTKSGTRDELLAFGDRG